MRYNKKTVLTTLNMAIPAIIESFFLAFAGFVDSMMVSSLGSRAVAAVGLTGQPKLLGLAIFIAINVSLSALVARRFGEKKKREANIIIISAFVMIIVLAVIISIVAVVLAPEIIRLCGSNKDTHEMAVLYFRIIMAGMIFNCIQMGVNSAQRGAGNTKITMRTNIVSNTINIIFNYLLIGGKFGFPALGIMGAAIATVLGTVVSSVMSILSIMKKDSFLSIMYIIKEKVKPSFKALKSIIKVGYSVFFEQLLLRAGLMMTALMAADQGTDAFAAHQVGMNVMSLSFAFGDGLQSAAVALSGRSLGEKNSDAAKDYGKTCQLIGTVTSALLFFLYFFGGKMIMQWFFDEVNIINIGIKIMYVTIFVVIFQTRQMVYMGILRGAGDTLFTAVVTAVATTLVRNLVAYIGCYTLGFGIMGIWFGLVADHATRVVCGSIRFKMGKWANIRI